MMKMPWIFLKHLSLFRKYDIIRKIVLNLGERV